MKCLFRAAEARTIKQLLKELPRQAARAVRFEPKKGGQIDLTDPMGQELLARYAAQQQGDRLP